MALSEMFPGTHETLGLKSLHLLVEYCLSVLNNVDYPAIGLPLLVPYKMVKGKGKPISVKAWTNPQGSRRLRQPYFMIIGI